MVTYRKKSLKLRELPQSLSNQTVTVTYTAATQKQCWYGKITKDWIIRIEISQIIVFFLTKGILKLIALVYNKPFGMNRKYNNLRKTFRDYNNDALLDKDDGIVQTTTE